MARRQRECGQSELLHAEVASHQQQRFKRTDRSQNHLLRKRPCRTAEEHACESPGTGIWEQVGNIWLVGGSLIDQSQDPVSGESSHQHEARPSLKGLE